MAYTASATTKGGRNGRAILDDGGLALAMGLPKDIGGNGEGHNPEQLFALGWSSCFGQAILSLAKKHGLDGQDARGDVLRDAEYARLHARSRTQGCASGRRSRPSSRRWSKKPIRFAPIQRRRAAMCP